MVGRSSCRPNSGTCSTTSTVKRAFCEEWYRESGEMRGSRTSVRTPQRDQPAIWSRRGSAVINTSARVVEANEWTLRWDGTPENYKSRQVKTTRAHPMLLLLPLPPPSAPSRTCRQPSKWTISAAELQPCSYNMRQFGLADMAARRWQCCRLLRRESSPRQMLPTTHPFIVPRTPRQRG